MVLLRLGISVTAFVVSATTLGFTVFPTLFCEEGWELFVGSCYKLFDDKLNWTDAKEFCTNHGAKLAEPNTRRIIEYLKNHSLHSYTESNIWLGGKDSAAEGEFAWDSVNKNIALFDFEDGEPNGKTEDEDCIEMCHIFSMKWNDRLCKRKNNFICETRSKLTATKDVTVTIGESISLPCPVNEPLPVDVTNVLWKKQKPAGGEEKLPSAYVSGGTITNPSLKIEVAQHDDMGIYECYSLAVTGPRIYVFDLTVVEDETVCPCTCEYEENVFSQSPSNLSREALILKLKPEIIKLQNELRVNKTSLSSKRRKQTSAADGRKSTQAIGWIGAGFIILVVSLVILIDIVNLLQFTNIIHI